MLKQKRKTKHPATSYNRVSFLIFWICGYAVSWIIVQALESPIEVLANRWNRDFFEVTFIVLLVGLITTVTQWVLMRHVLKLYIQHWLLVSLLGWALAALLFVPISLEIHTSNDNLEIIIVASAFFLPAIALQAGLLSQHVQRAWLWLLAGSTGTALFAMPIAMTDGGIIVVAISYGLYALLMAVTIMMLATMPCQKRK